uniref:Photosystem I assembly protein Ycf4 n=1 Tax=Marsupiomonas sp. NIES 1824 TaxID=1562198 RepID=A0A097KLY1_9CHLO|nr:hypothetical chloroplast RF4 [Marsupiomonas sp. NIES 1824]
MDDSCIKRRRIKNKKRLSIEMNTVKYEPIVGSRRLSNYSWALITGLGGFGFLITGLSSFFEKNLLPFIHVEEILFFPQGLVMCFYGILGLLFSLYTWFTILWSIGEGFNEFDKKNGQIRIFRWGFPGKNRKIDLKYDFNEVLSVRISVKDGLNPKRILYLCLKGQRQIPLTRVGNPLTIEEIETQGAELAKFLQVPLEGL